MEKENKIVIETVDKDLITIVVAGERKQVANNVDSLKELLKAQGQSTFQIGEKVYNIGEINEANFNTTIHQNFNESKTSRYIKFFLFVLVPLLAIGFAILFVKYRASQQPGILTVTITDVTPNKNLPIEPGNLLLFYGSKVDTVNTIAGATFKEIPSNLKGDKLRITFSAAGFVSIDTTFSYDKDQLALSIRRDDTFGSLSGSVKSDEGQALEGVMISILGLTTSSNNAGRWEIDIPFAQQAREQKVHAHLQGYRDWEYTTPVIVDSPVEIVMQLLPSNR